MKKFLTAVLSFAVMASAFSFVGCNDGDAQQKDKFAYRTEEKTEYMQSIYLTDYVSSLDEAETAAFTAEGNGNKQGSCYKGIAVSSFYTTKVNGEDAYTYMISTAETAPHSVVFIDVSEDEIGGDKKLDFEVTGKIDVEKSIVLPEKYGVTTQSTEKTVKFSVSDYGTYTLIVNDEKNPQYAYTVFVRRPEKVEVPYGYTLIEYKPGLHFVDNITLKSNTVLYLHAGALLVAKNPAVLSEGKGFISAANANDVKIVGHGVIDFSQMAWHAARGLYMNSCTNVEVDGVTMINSSTWTMTYMYCEKLTINDCIIFGYRQNSDAYAICSSNDVTVSDCFARSGDDLFEVKTYGAEAKNILFENCVAWPDNCRGFGIIQETNSNISGVTYRNCSLLYQLNDWSEKMAAFVVTAGEKGSVSDLVFDHCDLFYSEVFAIRFSVGANDETSGVTGFSNKITNVTFKDCAFKYPSSVRGIIKFRNATDEAKAISGIVFENSMFGGKKLTDLSVLNPVYEGAAPEVEIK